MEDWLDAYAIRLNPHRARGEDFTVLLHTPEGSALISVARQTEFAQIGEYHQAADVTATATRDAFEARMNGQAAEIKLEGNDDLFERWLGLHDTFDLWFKIATP